MTTQGRSYLLSARGKVQPGKAAEFAQRWQAYYASKARELAGFREAFYSADEETNTTLALWVWDGKPDEAQWRQAVQGFSTQVGDLSDGAPTIEWYEVLAQI